MSATGTKFNIGRDARLTTLVRGQPIGAIDVTNFEAKQMTKRLESNPINGEPAYRDLEQGWEISFDHDRKSDVLDRFFADKEAALYASGEVPDISITQRINEMDGSVSRYRFTGVTLKLDDAGSWKSDEKVTQKVSGTAARRIKVS